MIVVHAIADAFAAKFKDKAAAMPVGGTKRSGCGRLGGKADIESFIGLRWIINETRRGHCPG